MKYFYWQIDGTEYIAALNSNSFIWRDPGTNWSSLTIMSPTARFTEEWFKSSSLSNLKEAATIEELFLEIL